MVRKWRKLAPFYFRATATAPLFFALGPPRHASPFSVRASGAVALKVTQALKVHKSLQKSFGGGQNLVTLEIFCINGLHLIYKVLNNLCSLYYQFACFLISLFDIRTMKYMITNLIN